MTHDVNGDGDGAATAIESFVGEARRAAGLTEKELARGLGLSLWDLERLERGELDTEPHAEALERHTGRPASLFRSNLPSDPEDGAPLEDAPPEGASPPAAGGNGAKYLVLGSIAALVLIRFFTEVLDLLTRTANFIDIPIALLLAFAALIYTKNDTVHDPWAKSLLGLGGGLLLLITVAFLTNTTRVATGPALVFAYGILSPLVVYVAVRRLWPVGSAFAASRLLVFLGLVQLVVVTFIDLPRFLGSGNPDAVSGTFGTNAYQLVFFLLLFMTLLAGIYTYERDRLVARFAPILIGAAFAAIILAQYRALLIATGLAILLTAIVLGTAGGRGRGLIAAAVVVLGFMTTISLAAQNLPVLKLDQTLEQDPATLVSKRLDVGDQVVRLYSEEPRSILVGTGPGTFSSRAWATFALSDSQSVSNVAGGYARSLTGGKAYRTDVSDKYIRPLLSPGQDVISGSRAVTSPFSNYLSVAAEIGLFGLIMLLVIYVGAFIGALRRAIAAARDAPRGDPVPALLMTSMVGFFVLLQMGALENWLEVTRLTFIAWAIFAIASKEYDARSGSRA